MLYACNFNIDGKCAMRGIPCPDCDCMTTSDYEKCIQEMAAEIWNLTETLKGYSKPRETPAPNPSILDQCKRCTKSPHGAACKDGYTRNGSTCDNFVENQQPIQKPTPNATKQEEK